MTLDAAVLVTSGLLVVRRHLTNASVVRRLAVPVAIQAAYFTTSTAIAGGSPGQLLAGLRVVDAVLVGGPVGARPCCGGWCGPVLGSSPESSQLSSGIPRRRRRLDWRFCVRNRVDSLKSSPMTQTN